MTNAAYINRVNTKPGPVTLWTWKLPNDKITHAKKEITG
jgi:hypothetical protein